MGAATLGRAMSAARHLRRAGADRGSALKGAADNAGIGASGRKQNTAVRCAATYIHHHRPRRQLAGTRLPNNAKQN